MSDSQWPVGLVNILQFNNILENHTFSSIVDSRLLMDIDKLQVQIPSNVW